jgi:hypothetical protein
MRILKTEFFIAQFLFFAHDPYRCGKVIYLSQLFFAHGLKTGVQKVNV